MKIIKNFIELVKFEHTVFALPFAYIGAMLSGGEHTLEKWILITIAMAGARTAGMALNRLIDLRYDARNPRTADRTLPKKKMKLSTVLIITIVSLAIFEYAAYSLNTLTLILSPLAIIMLVSYSYLKRFTYLSHVVLGLILASAPIGGWIAMTGNLEITPVILGAAVMFWVAGFDIIYACQDYDFDKKENLHSIPVKFGVKQALAISYVFHILTLILLFATGWLLNQNIYFYIGVMITAGFIVYEHMLVKPGETHNINKAFFVVNSWVSMVLFTFTLIAKVLV